MLEQECVTGFQESSRALKRDDRMFYGRFSCVWCEGLKRTEIYMVKRRVEKNLGRLNAVTGYPMDVFRVLTSL